MKIKSQYNLLSFSALLLYLFTMEASAENFPTVDLQGKHFFYYSVKKGDSLYGISKQNSWDIDTIRKYNKKVFSGLKKDMRIYYPADAKPADYELKVSDKKSILIPLDPDHVVKKGETVYGIAKHYGIPVADIYSLNPSAKFGIREGEKLKMPATLLADIKQYTIRQGDTPYSVAKLFNTGVSDIYKANPGISDKNFKYGHKIMIPVNTNEKRLRTEIVKENQLQGFDTYKAKSGDSWNGIAKKYGVTVEDLTEINEGVEMKKGAIVAVPDYAMVDVKKTYVEEDPREKTEEGRNMIYEEVAKARNITPGNVRMAVVLDAPASRKDMEFSRGLIASLDVHKNSGYEISFKIIDGTHSSDSIVNVLTEFNPNLLISTADNLPAYLSDYSGSHSVALLNTFDVKSDATSSNPYIIQLLPPSDIFTNITARYISDTFGKRKIIFVGRTENDEIAQALCKRFESSQRMDMSPEELLDYPFYDNENYLIYCASTDRNEVSGILDKIIDIRLTSPMSEISVIGKPSWITFVDALSEKFSRADVYFPSRFYFDTATPDSKQFMNTYKNIYNHPPYKSYPIYSVTGFDVGNYFFDAVGRNGGDFSGESQLFSAGNTMLQNDINLIRVSNGAGLINVASYLVRFLPGQITDKIKITQ